MLPTIAREADVVVMIDQRKLPSEEIYVRCKTAAEVARAKSLLATSNPSRLEIHPAGESEAVSAMAHDDV